MNRFLFTLLFTISCLLAFCQEAPTLQCLQLREANTKLYVAWENSADCNQFTKYYFYVNNTLSDSLIPSPGTTVCDYRDKVINNLPAGPHYSSYIKAVDAAGTLYASDELQTINLTVTQSTDSALAYLEWESFSSEPLPDNWEGTFSIYKKYDFEADFPITPTAIVPNTQFTYIDTSDVCYSYVSYQVGITNFYSETESCIYKTNIESTLLVDRFAPTMPILDSISYTADNRVGIGFHAPDNFMRGFIIYYLNNGWEPIDTIYDATYWIDPNGGDRCYRLAVLDSCYNSSPMTIDEQCDMSIYVNSIDACHRSVNLSWNTYTNMLNGVHQYEVFYSMDNGASWLSAGTTTGHTLTINDLSNNIEYLAFVRATNNGESITASSNRVDFTITAEESTDFTYIRSVSVIDNNHIEVMVHTSGDTLPFESITLQRSLDGINFEPLQTLNHQNNSEYTFTDNSADFNNQLYYYQTYVINGCDMKSGYSNISHNILLTGEATAAQENNIQWNNYGTWSGDISHYTIYRKLETESSFSAMPGSLFPISVNTFNDDVSQLYEYGSKFTYFVEAQETVNEYGFNDISYSNHVTLNQSPCTYIPNAFTPLEATNNVFMPINSFVSTEDYSFTIFSRYGDKVFSTKDPYQGWNGFFNGQSAPMGVYVYRISYTLPDGNTFVKTGSVTLLH